MKQESFVSSNADRIITLIIQVFVMLALIWCLAGCSVKWEIGYHGRTGRDDLTTSPELTQASQKSRRY